MWLGHPQQCWCCHWKAVTQTCWTFKQHTSAWWGNVKCIFVVWFCCCISVAAFVLLHALLFFFFFCMGFKCANMPFLLFAGFLGNLADWFAENPSTCGRYCQGFQGMCFFFFVLEKFILTMLQVFCLHPTVIPRRVFVKLCWHCLFDTCVCMQWMTDQTWECYFDC